jgi:acyl-coenzyme A synthetase/AMP-(fatty) acid ligase
MNITDPIRYRAQISPSAIAVIRADRSVVSYRDLEQMIDAAAARVDGIGLVPGQICGLAITGPDELVPLVLALALAQCGIATADPALPAEHLHVCLTRGGVAAAREVGYDAGWIRPSGTAMARPMHRDGSAICRIFASSGTTGTPKFAAISHDLIARRIFSNGLSMGAVERVNICAVGFGITAGFCAVLRIFWSGATLVLSNPADAVAAIRRHEVNSILIAPGSLAAVVSALPDDHTPPPSLRAVETGGSPLSPRLLELVRQKLCGNVVSYFGSTETGGVASAPFAVLQGEGAVGYVHAGVEVQAVGPEGKPLPPGIEGVLRIRGGNNVTGYFGEADQPTEIFKDGWFLPGDIGSVTLDGIMTVNGRVGEFINAGGVKVNPRVIEDVLIALPNVTDAAAFGVPDRLGVTQIWAAIVASIAIPLPVLRTACREKLAGNAPKFILQVQALPRNANGKVVREELVRFAQTQQP